MMDSKKGLDSVPHNLVKSALRCFSKFTIQFTVFLSPWIQGSKNFQSSGFFCWARESKMARRENGLSEGQAKVLFFKFFFKAYRLTSCFFFLVKFWTINYLNKHHSLSSFPFCWQLTNVNLKDFRPQNSLNTLAYLYKFWHVHRLTLKS